MECIELSLLCKHMKNVRSSQASTSVHSCVELSKIVFLCEYRYWNVQSRYFYLLITNIVTRTATALSVQVTMLQTSKREKNK